MCRLRFAGGRVQAHQLRGFADLAQRFGQPRLQLTARSNLQLRGIGAEAGPQVLSGLLELGIINQGSGANFHTQKIFPAYIIPRKFEGTGAVEIGVKDLKCFLEEARRLRAETPMADAVTAVGIRAAESGPAGRDTMTLFHYFCDLAGVPRRG